MSEQSGGLKYDAGKPRLELIPWRAVAYSLGSPAMSRAQAIEAIGDYLEGGELRKLKHATCHVLARLEGDGAVRIPWRALVEVARVLTFGAQKYAAHNWRKGGPLTQGRTIGAALRHLAAQDRGEEIDQESQCLHLACAACELLFALTYALEGRGDDRWRPGAALGADTAGVVGATGPARIKGAGEGDRPECVPPDAQAWAWATNGDGVRVPIWVPVRPIKVLGGGDHMCVHVYDTRGPDWHPWVWSPGASGWDFCGIPQVSQGLADACRDLLASLDRKSATADAPAP